MEHGRAPSRRPLPASTPSTPPSSPPSSASRRPALYRSRQAAPSLPPHRRCVDSSSACSKRGSSPLDPRPPRVGGIENAVLLPRDKPMKIKFPSLILISPIKPTYNYTSPLLHALAAPRIGMLQALTAPGSRALHSRFRAYRRAPGGSVRRCGRSFLSSPCSLRLLSENEPMAEHDDDQHQPVPSARRLLYRLKDKRPLTETSKMTCRAPPPPAARLSSSQSYGKSTKVKGVLQVQQGSRLKKIPKEKGKALPSPPPGPGPLTLVSMHFDQFFRIQSVN